MSRRKQPKKPRRRSRSLRFIVFLFSLLLIVGGAIYIASLPIWQIKDVIVNGAVMLSPEEVRTLAAIPLSENLFFTSFDRAEANLKRLTPIKKFKFYRIPPATVLISIEEREPIATVIMADRSIIIDKDGYIINRNPNLSLNLPNRADLPVVSGIAESMIVQSDRLDAQAAAVIAQIINKLSPYLEAKRMQLEMGRLQNLNLLLDDMLRVKVGEARQVARKMEVFEALLPVIAGRWGQVEYVDVRYPDNPVIRYRAP